MRANRAEGRTPRFPSPAFRQDAGGNARRRDQQDLRDLSVVLQHRHPRSGPGGNFADSRAGKHAQAFLGEWRGTLICDYAGYKALIAQGVTEAGCMAHAHRKLFELQGKPPAIPS